MSQQEDALFCLATLHYVYAPATTMQTTTSRSCQATLAARLAVAQHDNKSLSVCAAPALLVGVMQAP